MSTSEFRATDRRTFIRQGIASGAAIAAAGCAPSSDGQQDTRPAATAGTTTAVPAFELSELGVGDLQAAMGSGKYTSGRLVELYLERIEQVDRTGPAINSVIERNPEAAAIAEGLDRERKDGNVRGPLHGIPVLLKDNIDTADRMRTSAGSLALAESIAPRDAGLVRRLREAGAVILGKVNLSEWANIRSSRSTSGWSGRGGLTKNPYALDRNACGSSAGTGAAIAASLATLGVGTETDGSIVCPSNANGLVGIKPTVGLVSRSGIIPISHTQDTAGPMCRNVRDAAALLSVMAGADPDDQATATSAGHVESDYTSFCVPDGLRGAKVGVVRAWFNAGPHVERVMRGALEAIVSAGATLVDPIAIPSIAELGDDEFTVLLHELKADMSTYLATLGPSIPYRTLADLIRFNETNASTEMPYFGQETFIAAEEKGPLTSPAYLRALERCRRLSRTQGLDRAFAGGAVDVLVAPTGGPAWVTDLVNGDHFGGGSSTACAVSGYPAITVPAGQVFGLPVGLTFMGPAWSEGRLVRYAFAFEQATNARRAPTFRPHAEVPAT
ncbi:MAG: amidase [Gemmatimonadaceae bacterium]|nr:amidase [Gemmatimonadaceae bacterium]